MDLSTTRTEQLLHYFRRHHGRPSSTVSPWDVTTTDFYPHDESTKSILSVSYEGNVEERAEELGLPAWGQFAIFIVVGIVILGIGFFIIRRYFWKRHNAHRHGEVKPTALLE